MSVIKSKTKSGKYARITVLVSKSCCYNSIKSKMLLTVYIACRGDYQNDSTDAILRVYHRQVIEQLAFALEIMYGTVLLCQFYFRSPHSAETNLCTL